MRTTVLTLSFLLLASPARAGGKEVLVAFGRQSAIKGELVTVGDSSLVVAVESDGAELRTVLVADVQYVIIKEREYAATGAGIGALGGGIIGAIIGISAAPSESHWFSPKTIGGLEGAGIGAVVGLAIGYGVGSAASSAEIRVTPEESRFRQVLSTAARNAR